MTTFHSSLNYVNSLLHECPYFEDILLLTVNRYGRIIIHFSDKSLTRIQVVRLMEELKIKEYNVSFSDMYYRYCVSFKPNE